MIAPPIDSHKGRGRSRAVDNKWARGNIEFTWTTVETTNALTAIGLAIVSLFGTLWMLLFNARLNLKADRTELAVTITEAIDRYHELVAKEFKEEMLRMHLDNTRKLEQIDSSNRETMRLLGRIETAVRLPPTGAK